MPKFLDVPQWYNSDGDLVTGASLLNSVRTPYIVSEFNYASTNEQTEARGCFIYDYLTSGVSSYLGLLSALSGAGEGTSFFLLASGLYRINSNYYTLSGISISFGIITFIGFQGSSSSILIRKTFSIENTEISRITETIHQSSFAKGDIV